MEGCSLLRRGSVTTAVRFSKNPTALRADVSTTSFKLPRRGTQLVARCLDPTVVTALVNMITKTSNRYGVLPLTVDGFIVSKKSQENPSGNGRHDAQCPARASCVPENNVITCALCRFRAAGCGGKLCGAGLGGAAQVWSSNSYQILILCPSVCLSV